MPRQKTILQDKFPYHITGRCINKDWFDLPLHKVWKIFCEELYMTSIVHNLKIHSFVLMSNHYHLIASTPDSNLSTCMQRLSKQVSLRITKTGKRINQTFGARYFKSILHQPNYFLNTYKYNYRNPVEAGICKKVQDYPYSSLNMILGESKLEFSVVHDDTLFNNIEDTLRWLNNEPDPIKTEAIKWALRRPYFESKKDSQNKLILETNELI